MEVSKYSWSSSLRLKWTQAIELTWPGKISFPLLTPWVRSEDLRCHTKMAMQGYTLHVCSQKTLLEAINPYHSVSGSLASMLLVHVFELSFDSDIGYNPHRLLYNYKP